MPDRTHTETIRFDPETGLHFAWRGSHTVNVRRSPDGDDVDCFSLGYGAGDPGLTVDDFHAHINDYLASPEIGNELRCPTDHDDLDGGAWCAICGR